MKKRTVEGGGYSGRGDGRYGRYGQEEREKLESPLEPEQTAAAPALPLPRVTSRLPARGVLFQGWWHYVRFPKEN